MLKAKRLLSLLLLLSVVSGCNEQLVHDLSENEAIRLITRLENAQISATKEKQSDGKWSLTVPQDQYIGALKYIEAARLLKISQVEPVYQSSMIQSRDEERFHFERSLSSEVESTLLRVRGVLEARVHLNLPQVDPLLGRRQKNDSGSGSVLLVTAKDFGLSNEEVAQLVSGAAGLNVTAVSVLISKEDNSKEIEHRAAITSNVHKDMSLAPSGIVGGTLGSLLIFVGLYAVTRNFRKR